jgi:hypothetical protein
MARISEQVLAGLARPTMAQGMFDLGAAIGGVPGQMKQKRQEDEFNQLMADAQKAQQANNEAELFSVAQKLRAMGRNTAANTVAATATKLRETNRQRGLASAISSAEQLAREGADIQPLLQDITELGGTPEQLRSVSSIVSNREMNQKEALLQQALASPTFDFESKKDEFAYFKGAAQMGVAPDRAREIYDSFKSAGDVTFVNAGRYVDTQGNIYNAQIERDKSGRQIGIIYAPVGNSPPYSEVTPDGKPNPLTETGGYGLTARGKLEVNVEEASRERLETEFAELRVGALKDLPELQQTASSLEEAIALLASDEVRQGGVPRAVSANILRFMGVDSVPKELGRFQGLLAKAVMDRLQGFSGSISDGERQYSIDSINDYLSSNQVNIGRLSVLLDEANRSIEKSIKIGQSSGFNEYRRSSGIVTEMDFYDLPVEDRADALEAVRSGKYTYNQIMQVYRRR